MIARKKYLSFRSKTPLTKQKQKKSLSSRWIGKRIKSNSNYVSNKDISLWIHSTLTIQNNNKNTQKVVSIQLKFFSKKGNFNGWGVYLFVFYCFKPRPNFNYFNNCVEFFFFLE